MFDLYKILISNNAKVNMIVYKKFWYIITKGEYKYLKYFYDLFFEMNVMIFNIIFLILIDNYYNQ